MTATLSGTDTRLDLDHREYRTALLDAGLLIDSGVPGVYGLSGTFEGVIEQFEALLTRLSAPLEAEVIRFPPILNRQAYERTDHFDGFPNLLGSIHSFDGDERAHEVLLGRKAAGEDWGAGLSSTAVVMTPAACYPLYPASSGRLSPEGRLVDLRAFVFRHEPSNDPARMQIFRQREFVRLGSPAQAEEHRTYWLEKGQEILRAVGLAPVPVVANDPFFGRGGRFMAVSQREQTLKHELVVPVASADHPTAVVSCNYHLDHFGRPFDITTADGEVAHSACIGFGLERIALALFKQHGFEVARWPVAVRETLAL